METENSAVTTGPTGIHVKLIRGDVGMFYVRLTGHLFVKQSVPQDFCCSCVCLCKFLVYRRNANTSIL